MSSIESSPPLSPSASPPLSPPPVHPAPRKWAHTTYWRPIAQAWERVDNSRSVHNLAFLPCPLNINRVHSLMPMLNMVLEDVMAENKYTAADLTGWKTVLKDLLERLVSHMPDEPIGKARRTAVFVAATSSDLCATFQKRKDVRDMISAFDNRVALYTMTVPNLERGYALQRRENDPDTLTPHDV
ncbi:hypothetical protein CspeluHIS016_0803610 [Cutaneotrichosporon spelunceum]|uniref:Uncharacterized protein n=1 Tax=Cutaneotrichosporon spelunceum TaxID=1672016 RepID=A0AAD3U089_9TREE|nr:hypothetical protein CspeluHIS016_0803610 [Cutaneotrichosporon spelunceum]